VGGIRWTTGGMEIKRFKKVQVLSVDSQLRVNICPVEEMLDEDASIKYVRY